MTPQEKPQFLLDHDAVAGIAATAGQHAQGLGTVNSVPACAQMERR